MPRAAAVQLWQLVPMQIQRRNLAHQMLRVIVPAVTMAPGEMEVVVARSAPAPRKVVGPAQLPAEIHSHHCLHHLHHHPR